MQRGELDPMIENCLLSQRLFGAMAARLGVDPMRDGPVTRRGLEHTCAVCSVQGRCQQWLAPVATEGYEEFGPNAEYWYGLKERTRPTTDHGIVRSGHGSMPKYAAVIRLLATTYCVHPLPQR